MGIFGGGGGPSAGELQAQSDASASRERERIKIEELEADRAADTERDRLKRKRRGTRGNVFSRGPTLGGIGSSVKRPDLPIGFESREKVLQREFADGGNLSTFLKFAGDPSLKGRKILLGQ